MKIDRQERQVRNQTQHFVSVGSWLGYEPYAERIGLPPSATTQLGINYKYTAPGTTGGIRVAGL